MNYLQLPQDFDKASLKCPFAPCKCTVITISSSQFSEKKVIISEPPQCVHVNTNMEVEPQVKSKEQVFLQFNDAWDFDNIAVSKPTEIQKPKLDNKYIDIQRYLTCADCEKGPLGFAGFLKEIDETDEIKKAEKLVYFLCADSVKYAT